MYRVIAALWLIASAFCPIIGAPWQHGMAFMVIAVLWEIAHLLNTRLGRR